jgi:hypothetical protein
MRKSADKLGKSTGSVKHNKSAQSMSSKIDRDKDKSFEKSNPTPDDIVPNPNPQKSPDPEKSPPKDSLIKEADQDQENEDDKDSETRKVEEEIRQLEEEERQMELENDHRAKEQQEKEQEEKDQREKDAADQYAKDQENNKDLFDSGFTEKEPQRELAPKNDSKLLESDVYNESDIFGDSKKEPEGKKDEGDVFAEDDDEFGA